METGGNFFFGDLKVVSAFPQGCRGRRFLTGRRVATASVNKVKDHLSRKMKILL